MAILKCKICGGDVLPFPDKPLGTCQSCGTVSTLPRVDDEQRAGWFNRGNSLRMRGEFDKAADVFEKIILEDNADAEAHWCLMLCRYGIEYVEDPTTHERILTCHRVSLTPASLDVDYLAAIEHADPGARRLYELEAKRIDEVRKAILVVSSNEKPFDVFICYKDTSDVGSRTRDSVLAQDIYQALTADGLRVFFSRITLEDKLGTQYEPYIFAALNSAKVMLVVGTSKENLNAVWVKNEWSRFLALMKKDRSRMLIPCYRDMDPYELPDELAMLQSQDMGKIGFLQDLIRGVKKICRPEGSAASTSSVAAPVAAVSENTDALLERAYLCLSDGDYGKAEELLERVLDKNPKSAQAYLGKLMIDRHSKHEKELICADKPLSDNTNYIHAIEFADKELRQRLESYNAAIIEHNRQTDLVAAQAEYNRINEKANQDLKELNALLDEKRKALHVAESQIAPKVKPLEAEQQRLSEVLKKREAASRRCQDVLELLLSGIPLAFLLFFIIVGIVQKTSFWYIFLAVVIVGVLFKPWCWIATFLFAFVISPIRIAEKKASKAKAKIDDQVNAISDELNRVRSAAAEAGSVVSACVSARDKELNQINSRISRLIKEESPNT